MRTCLPPPSCSNISVMWWRKWQIEMSRHLFWLISDIDEITTPSTKNASRAPAEITATAFWFIKIHSSSVQSMASEPNSRWIHHYVSATCMSMFSYLECQICFNLAEKGSTWSIRHLLLSSYFWLDEEILLSQCRATVMEKLARTALLLFMPSRVTLTIDNHAFDYCRLTTVEGKLKIAMLMTIRRQCCWSRITHAHSHLSQ